MVSSFAFLLYCLIELLLLNYFLLFAAVICVAMGATFMFRAKEVLPVEKKIFWDDLKTARKILQGRAVDPNTGLALSAEQVGFVPRSCLLHFHTFFHLLTTEVCLPLLLLMQCHEMAAHQGFVSIRTVPAPIIKEEKTSKNEEDEQSKKRRQEMGVSEGCANP